MPGFQLLHRLPEELLQDILERLDESSLKSFDLASQWCYDVTTPLLWKDVTLTDCRTQHEDGLDEHDDTPLIRKLLILATNPRIAACVQTLTHRCHLPPPALLHELPRSPFSSQTLSTDPRTIRLVELATQHMVKVSTLRIVFGHPTLNDALLRCFFNKHRQKNVPVRRLWLESCRISAGCCLSLSEQPYGLPLELDFDGLESVRFRRLPLRPGVAWIGHHAPFEYVYARSRTYGEIQDGAGGQYYATLNFCAMEQTMGQQHSDWLAETATIEEGAVPDVLSPLEALYEDPNRFDDRIYSNLAELLKPEQLVMSDRHVPSHRHRSELMHRGSWLDPLDWDHCTAPSAWKQAQREKLPSSKVAIGLLDSASRSLTNLTLDWVFTMPTESNSSSGTRSQVLWMDIFFRLFSLRFPHLRAFQFRDAVVGKTQMLQGLYLLDHAQIPAGEGSLAMAGGGLTLSARPLDTACLSFMEAHPNLQCLAWPMDHFFSERPPAADIATRVSAVIDNLARTLIDLRIDTMYTDVFNQQTEDIPHPSRERRRRFIEQFASKMTKLESIKIEGGMPRDERRETARALHACALKKIVMIGVSSPLGNTWGLDGADMTEPVSHDEVEELEAEDKDAVWQHGMKKLESLGPDFRFEAEYGWPHGPPMLYTIASFHASTVTELKFCGYKGAPILFSPTPVTTPMLFALKHFHKLESLIISLRLPTFFEGSARDTEIISYWLNARSPTSTALVHVTDEEPEGWAKELRTKYGPDALASHIASLIGPFVSEQAKVRKGGIHVRACFCVGDWGGIFDVDVTIGKGAMGSNVCLGFKGPREELEPERRRSKLDSRRWF